MSVSVPFLKVSQIWNLKKLLVPDIKKLSGSKVEGENKQSVCVFLFECWSTLWFHFFEITCQMHSVGNATNCAFLSPSKKWHTKWVCNWKIRSFWTLENSPVQKKREEMSLVSVCSSLISDPLYGFIFLRYVSQKTQKHSGHWEILQLQSQRRKQGMRPMCSSLNSHPLALWFHFFEIPILTDRVFID